MRAAVLDAPGRLTVVDLPDPQPQAGDVVVRVAAAGVCGTDRHIFAGNYPVRLPLTLGHEYAGEVVALGDGVTSLSIGDRVTVDPNVVDDTCYFCRRGLTHLCSGLSPLGVIRPGGFAEYSVIPARYGYRLPDTISWAEASQIEPLACCLHGIDQAQVVPGDTVVISGAGPIGCLLIQLARLQGAKNVIAIEPNATRRQHALTAGADVTTTPDENLAVLESCNDGAGPDIIVEASGNPTAAEAALRLVRRGGTALMFAVYPDNAQIPVRPFNINENELRIIGSFNNPATHQRAIDLVSSGRVDLRPIITDELTLDELAAALDIKNYPTSGKIVIHPGPERPTAPRGGSE